MKLNITQPAASGDISEKKEWHYFFIIKNNNTVYDLFFNASDVTKDTSFEIAKSFSLK